MCCGNIRHIIFLYLYQVILPNDYSLELNVQYVQRFIIDLFMYIMLIKTHVYQTTKAIIFTQLFSHIIKCYQIYAAFFFLTILISICVLFILFKRKSNRWDNSSKYQKLFNLTLHLYISTLQSNFKSHL